MANTPGQRQRPMSGSRIEDSSVGSMQDPITGSERQYGDRIGSSNTSFGARDEAIREETIERNLGARDEASSSYSTASNTAARSERRADRGFTTTFAIAAIVLLGAFLVALYLGSRSSDVASNPGNQTPVTENAPATGTGTTTNDATGSTTPAPAPTDNTTIAPAPAPAEPPANSATDSGATGTGTAAPAPAPASP